MANNYIKIESVSEDAENKVKQTLKFQSDSFVWRIKFTAPLNPGTVNNQNLYVTSLNKTPLKTHIRYDSINKIIEIEPLEHYSKNESYILTITKKVRSAGGQQLKNDIQIQFKL